MSREPCPVNESSVMFTIPMIKGRRGKLIFLPLADRIISRLQIVAGLSSEFDELKSRIDFARLLAQPCRVHLVSNAVSLQRSYHRFVVPAKIASRAVTKFLR